MAGVDERRMTNGAVSQGATVGIIGGMGPAATCLLFERIVRATPAAQDQDHLHILVNSDPSVPDRTAAVVGDGPSPVGALVRSARLLERAGAEILAMPCVTAHLFLPEIRAAVAVRVLDLVDEIERELAAAHPRAARVGILCTDGSRRGGVFAPLEQGGRWELVWPTDEEQARFMDAVYGPSGVKSAGATRGACAAMSALAESLLARGADVVIAGCTEASIGLAGAVGRLPLVDGVEVLARAVVRDALNGRRAHAAPSHNGEAKAAVRRREG